MKKFLLLLLIQGFAVTRLAAQSKGSGHGLINWVTFEEAVKLNSKNPRMIFVDIYTTWCGPCKMLVSNTFSNEKIAKYMNENFYCVRFDAETRDTVKFSVNVPDTVRNQKGEVVKVGTRAQEFVYYNTFPPGTPRSTHQFAGSILQGYNVAFPSMIFITKDIRRVDVLQGYMPPQQFEPIIKFFGSGSWETIKWDEYQKNFKSDL